MNTLHQLAALYWIQQLGLTILHFLWQGALIAALYGAARRWTSTSPNARYLLACTALAAMAICPLSTWLLLQAPAPESAALSFRAPLSAARLQALPADPWYFPIRSAPVASHPFLAWVVSLWMLGATALSLRLLGRWIFAERLRSRRAHPAPALWQLTCDRLKSRLAVSRPVRLLVSGMVDAPAALGWLRPVVLVPVGALAGLPPAQMEALLLHELAHIRRQDYLVQILQSALEAIFFYHPAVWWISGHVRAERELCCDDLAVSITGDPIVYARALAEFASPRRAGSPLMASSGGSLYVRIARLLGQPAAVRRTTRSATLAPAVILLTLGGFLLFAQPEALPQFEVASVKPSSSRQIMAVRPLPGRLTADASLLVLMQYAFGVQPYQLAGGPGWLRSERFQIEAKAADNVTRDRIFLMLQALLQSRFRLQTHRETRELPVYALVPARNGLRLPQSEQDACVESPADAASEWAGGRISPPGGAPEKFRCGSAAVTLSPEGAQLRGEKVAMPELARELSLLLDRSVVDRTGFTGSFNMRVTFVADESTPALPPPPPGSNLSGAPLPQALQQQLGLRLEPAKGPVSVIVIDQVERPAAN